MCVTCWFGDTVSRANMKCLGIRNANVVVNSGLYHGVENCLGVRESTAPEGPCRV